MLTRLFAAFCALVLLANGLPARATPWHVDRITTNGSQQNGPIVSGNTIVWKDFRGPQGIDAWAYNITQANEYVVVSGTGIDSPAALEGNFLLYNETTDTESNIWRLNLMNNQKILIAGGSGDRAATGMSGDWVVYIEGAGTGHVIAKNFVTNEQVSIVTDGYRPRVSGDKLVYNYAGTGGSNIAGFDLTSRTSFDIAPINDGNEGLPDVYVNAVVWSRTDLGISSLFMKDLLTDQITTVASSSSQAIDYPTLSDRYIAWRQSEPLFQEGGSQAYAAIQNVWVKDLLTGTITQLSDDGPQQTSPSGIPSISDNHIAWFSWVTGNGDVYLATNLVPEPSTGILFALGICILFLLRSRKRA